MYRLFSHVSFSVSNAAGFDDTRDRSNAVDQLRRGTAPRGRRRATSRAARGSSRAPRAGSPARGTPDAGRAVALRQRLPVGAEHLRHVRVDGRGASERLDHARHCAGRAASRSSPRTTCVIPIAGRRPRPPAGTPAMPSARTITKSRSSPGAHRTSPFTRSSTTCSSSGIRNRTTGARPSASKAGDLGVGQRAAPAVVAGRLAPGARGLVPLLELLGRCSSSGRRAARRGARSPPPRRSAARSDCRYGPCGPPTSGPSSQSRPSQRRSSSTPRNASSVTRDASVSSTRRTNDAAVVPRPQPREQRGPRVADVQRPHGAGAKRQPDASRSRPPGSRSVPTPSTSTSTTSPCGDRADALRRAGEHARRRAAAS